MKRVLGALVVACLALAHEGRANACGGAFFGPTEQTVEVTDHRMAISISVNETIIWDQIRYTGTPTEFAFLFPVAPGSTVALSNDAWFTALDAYTAPTIYSPREVSSGGCALMGCGDSQSSSAGNVVGANNAVTHGTIGPYDLTTITPKTAAEVTNLLTTDGFLVPVGTDQVIADYIAEGMNFIFMRLRPGCGVQAMQPIRIAMPGSHPSVPLRLASAGTMATVSIELFVLSDQRYSPANYPVAAIDLADLRTGNGANNYEDLANAALAQNGSKSFLTEFAGSPTVPTLPPSTAFADNARAGVTAQDTEDTTDASAISGLGSGTLSTYYDSLCTARPASDVDGGCASDDDASGPDPFFDGSAIDASDHGTDAGEGDAGESDAASEASDDDGGDAAVMLSPHPLLPNAGAPPDVPALTCGTPSDLDVVLADIPSNKLYLTRMRAHLPQGEIAKADLQLQPSTDGDVSQYHQALANAGDDAPQSNPSGACRSAPRTRARADIWAVLGAIGFAAALVMRRSRRGRDKRGRPRK